MKYFFKPGFLKIFVTLILSPFIYMALSFIPSNTLGVCFPPTLNASLIQFCNSIAWFLDKTVLWFFPILAILLSYTICSALWYFLFRANRNVKETQKSTKQRLLKAIPLVTLIVISLFSIPFVLLAYFVPLFVITGTTAKITNESKQLVQEVLPYAESQKWQPIAEYNGPKGISNEIPWYVITFQTTQKPDEAKEGIYALLTQKGYTMKTIFYNPEPGDQPGTYKDDTFYVETTNHNQPYWILQGESKTGNTVEVTITDRTFRDNGEIKSIPPGMTAVTMHFSYKEESIRRHKSTPPPTFHKLEPSIPIR